MGYSKRISATIPRNGDLLTTQWLEIVLKKHDTNASYYPAEALLKEIEVEVGGQRIDKIYSDWFRVYDELYRSGSEKDAYRSMVDFDQPEAGADKGVYKRFYVPLVFFYNRAPGLALPLVRTLFSVSFPNPISHMYIVLFIAGGPSIP